MSSCQWSPTVFGRPVALLLVALLWLLPAVARAAEEDESTPLPLKRVVMFSSGVGFFEHRGDVDGDAHVNLKFRVDDVNDLLKSMVLQDLGGGQVSAVNYGSRDPITRTLKTFAIDLTTHPTLADLLKQIRGERVQVEAPTPIVGTIVGVEKRKVRVKDEVVEEDWVNLLTDQGLRSVNLASVTRIKLLDERLNAELQQALAILAMAHATDKKTVTLNFRGNGQRPVRVGYIQEAPIWKTSYRLVLDDEEQPFLQGWAIVENTTDHDWDDVALTLISGRPISFIMDLYQPLYVKRPVVVPELFASLRPQVYGQDLAAANEDFARSERQQMAPPASEAAAQLGARARGGRAGGLRSDSGEALDGYASRDNSVSKLTLSEGVQSLAQAGDVGELFRYEISTPVKLSRQQSAMLPIVNDSVKGEKLSIYNPNVHAKHPLNGLKLTNSTNLHLMQGPITVFDDGTYAGDARIEDLPPGTERLLSYAMDLDVEVAPESKGRPEQLVSVRIAKGTLFTTRKYTREQKYVIKNSGGKTKKVLIEYPFNSDWKLVAPKEPDEKTRDLYRFAVTAEPGKPANLDIEEEQVINQSWAVTNLDDGMILFYMNAKVISPEVKEALGEVIKRKQAIEDVVSQRSLREQEIQTVEREQNRIRQNMGQLDRTSDLYSRYVKMFGEQEDRVTELRAQIKRLQDEETKLRQQLDEYLLDLDVK